MSTRRRFLTRVAATVAAGAGLLAARAIPAVQRIAEQSPRYILNPETGVWFERVKDGVYQALAR